MEWDYMEMTEEEIKEANKIAMESYKSETDSYYWD